MSGSATVIIDLVAVKTKRVRKQQQTQAMRNLLKVCSQLFNLFLTEVLLSGIVDAVH